MNALLSINCSTIGILLSIVVQFMCHRGYIVTHCDTSILCMPLWFLTLFGCSSYYQLIHHRLLVYCGLIQESPWVSCYPTGLHFSHDTICFLTFVDALLGLPVYCGSHQVSPWVVLPDMTLRISHLVSYLFDCSSLTINRSTICILWCIVN